jgi:O-antigen/teichoic acid export membrane protein
MVAGPPLLIGYLLPTSDTPNNRLRNATSSARFQKLAGDSGWALGVELSRLVSGLSTIYLLGNALGSQGYGAYAGMFAVVGVLSGIVNGAVSLSLVQSVARDRKDAQSMIRSHSGTAVASSIAVVVLALILIGVSVESISSLSILGFVFTELALISAIEFVGSVFFAHGQFRVRAQIQILVLGVRTSVVVGLYLLDKLTLEALILANLMLFLLSLPLLIKWVMPRLSLVLRPGRPETEEVVQIGKFAAPMVANSLLSDGDKVVLSAVQSNAIVGEYAMAYRVVSIAFLPVDVIISSSHLHFLDNDTDGNGAQVKRAARFTAVSVLYSCVAMAVVWLLAPFVIDFISEDFDAARKMVPWLLAFLPLHATWPFALSGLLGLGRVGARSWIMIGSSVVSLAAYATLIPWLGWKGGALGTIVSEVVLSIVAWAALLHAQRAHDAGSRNEALSDR